MIAHLNVNAAVHLGELFYGYQTFGLVAKIDYDVFIVEFHDAALQQFAIVRRSKMGVIVDELLVIRFFGYGRIQILLICFAGHAQTPDSATTTAQTDRRVSTSEFKTTGLSDFGRSPIALSADKPL